MSLFVRFFRLIIFFPNGFSHSAEPRVKTMASKMPLLGPRRAPIAFRRRWPVRFLGHATPSVGVGPLVFRHCHDLLATCHGIGQRNSRSGRVPDTASDTVRSDFRRVSDGRASTSLSYFRSSIPPTRRCVLGGSLFYGRVYSSSPFPLFFFAPVPDSFPYGLVRLS